MLFRKFIDDFEEVIDKVWMSDEIQNRYNAGEPIYTNELIDKAIAIYNEEQKEKKNIIKMPKLPDNFEELSIPDKIIELIKVKVLPYENWGEGAESVQMFNCLGSGEAAFDPKITIFEDPHNRVYVYYANTWNYVEVIGLSKEDYDKVFRAVGA